jgi:3-dehydroquinate synthetase
VPVAHYRSAQITSYPLTISSLSQYHFADNDLVIIDSGLWDVIKKLDSVNYIKLEPIEAETKALATADKLLDSLKNKNVKRIIGIGGGIVLNVVSYIAEQLKADLEAGLERGVQAVRCSLEDGFETAMNQFNPA